MLSSILTRQQCAECRNCCVMFEESLWELPMVSKQRSEMICAELSDPEATVPRKAGFQLSHRDVEDRQSAAGEGRETHRCAALDEHRGCRLSTEAKPPECSIWPVRVMRDQGRIYITLARGCPAVDSAFEDNVTALLNESLKERILELIKDEPAMIKPFAPNYIRLMDITEEAGGARGK